MILVNFPLIWPDQDQRKSVSQALENRPNRSCERSLLSFLYFFSLLVLKNLLQSKDIIMAVLFDRVGPMTGHEILNHRMEETTLTTRKELTCWEFIQEAFILLAEKIYSFFLCAFCKLIPNQEDVVTLQSRISSPTGKTPLLLGTFDTTRERTEQRPRDIRLLDLSGACTPRTTEANEPAAITTLKDNYYRHREDPLIRACVVYHMLQHYSREGGDNPVNIIPLIEYLDGYGAETRLVTTTILQMAYTVSTSDTAALLERLRADENLVELTDSFDLWITTRLNYEVENFTWEMELGREDQPALTRRCYSILGHLIAFGTGYFSNDALVIPLLDWLQSTFPDSEMARRTQAAKQLLETEESGDDLHLKSTLIWMQAQLAVEAAMRPHELVTQTQIRRWDAMHSSPNVVVAYLPRSGAITRLAALERMQSSLASDPVDAAIFWIQLMGYGQEERDDIEIDCGSDTVDSVYRSILTNLLTSPFGSTILATIAEDLGADTDATGLERIREIAIKNYESLTLIWGCFNAACTKLHQFLDHFLDRRRSTFTIGEFRSIAISIYRLSMPKQGTQAFSLCEKFTAAWQRAMTNETFASAFRAKQSEHEVTASVTRWRGAPPPFQHLGHMQILSVMDSSDIPLPFREER